RTHHLALTVANPGALFQAIVHAGLPGILGSRLAPWFSVALRSSSERHMLRLRRSCGPTAQQRCTTIFTAQSSPLGGSLLHAHCNLAFGDRHKVVLVLLSEVLREFGPSQAGARHLEPTLFPPHLAIGGS